MSKSYRLVYIADLLQLPPDRIQDCLNELIPHLQDLQKLKGDLSDAGVDDLSVGGITWTDDGKDEVKVKLELRGNDG